MNRIFALLLAATTFGCTSAEPAYAANWDELASVVFVNWREGEDDAFNNGWHVFCYVTPGLG